MSFVGSGCHRSSRADITCGSRSGVDGNRWSERRRIGPICSPAHLGPLQTDPTDRLYPCRSLRKRRRRPPTSMRSRPATDVGFVSRDLVPIGSPLSDCYSRIQSESCAENTRMIRDRRTNFRGQPPRIATSRACCQRGAKSIHGYWSFGTSTGHCARGPRTSTRCRDGSQGTNVGRADGTRTVAHR